MALLYLLLTLYLYLLLALYITIWSNFSHLKFSTIIWQPQTYLKYSKVKLKNVAAIIFFPVVIIAIALFSDIIISMFFGGITKSNGEDLYFWGIISTVKSTYLLPITAMFIVSSRRTRCVVCKGKKYVEGPNDVIDKFYAKKTRCFCCNGKGYVTNNSTIGASHQSLETNIQLMRKFEGQKKQLTKALSNLKASSSEGLRDKLKAKEAYATEVFDFYDATVRKLSHLIQEHHIHKEFEFDTADYTEELKAVFLNNEQYVQEEKELLYALEVINQKILLEDNTPDVIHAMRTEVQKINEQL